MKNHDFSYKNLLFPVAGINKKHSFQSQPPYTTPEALNMRPETLPDRRVRGGSRPGIGKYITDGVGSRINLLAQVRGGKYEYVELPPDQVPIIWPDPPTPDPEDSCIDDLDWRLWPQFEDEESSSSSDSSSSSSSSGSDSSDSSDSDSSDSSSGYWEQYSTQGMFMDDFEGTKISTVDWRRIAGYELPDVSENPPADKYHPQVGAFLKKIDLDSTLRMRVQMNVKRSKPITDETNPNYGKYTIFMGMDDENPSIDDCVRADLTITENGNSVSLNSSTSLEPSNAAIGDSPLENCTFMLSVESDGTAKVFLDDDLVAQTNVGTLAGGRIGFALSSDVPGGISSIESISFWYYTTTRVWVKGDGPEPPIIDDPRIDPIIEPIIIVTPIDPDKPQEIISSGNGTTSGVTVTTIGEYIVRVYRGYSGDGTPWEKHPETIEIISSDNKTVLFKYDLPQAWTDMAAIGNLYNLDLPEEEDDDKTNANVKDRLIRLMTKSDTVRAITFGGELTATTPEDDLYTRLFTANDEKMTAKLVFGTILHIGPCGAMILRAPDGTIVTCQKNGITTVETPSGMVTILYNDGSADVHTTDGRVVHIEGTKFTTGKKGMWVLNRSADVLVAGGGGRLYAERNHGELNYENEGGIEIQQKNGHVSCASRQKELFVADYMSYSLDGKIFKAEYTNGNIDAGVLSCSSIADWTTLGIVKGSDMVTIYDGDPTVTVGTYLIADVSETGITLDGYDHENGVGDGSCSFQVTVSPKIFNFAQRTFEPWLARYGAVPQNCPLICLYRDRVVLAGADDNPHIWYMSRQGDPYDWNYVADPAAESVDYGIAVAGQNSNAGIIGQPIRAIIPHSDDYLLFGYDTEIWILRGDPVANGNIECVSREVGIVSRRAWCYGESGEVYVLSQKGVYVVNSGYSAPVAISTDKMPIDLLDRVFVQNIQMVYDHDWHGIHIFTEDMNGQWFFNLETQSWWQIVFCNKMNPSAALRYKGNTLIGCTDGFIRQYKDEMVTDEGYPIVSGVIIGPIRVSDNDFYEGVIQKMCASLDGTFAGQGVKMFVYAGVDEQDAWYKVERNTPAESYTMPGRLSTHIRRIRAGVVYIMLRQNEQKNMKSKNGLNAWWGMEHIGMWTKNGGKMRRL